METYTWFVIFALVAVGGFIVYKIRARRPPIEGYGSGKPSDGPQDKPGFKND